jgi:2-succinyl-6-hydroxy-2,4-cyclohexadiene-1-carboxylate synthase
MCADKMLYVEHSGDRSNPSVVLIHGFMGNTQDWAPVIQRLAPRFFCLAVDLPGHGKSLELEQAFTFQGVAEAIVQVLEANKVTSSRFVGYSMGGRIALYLAVHYPHLCSALVLESATAGISDQKDRAERREIDDHWARRLEQGVFEEFLRTWYSQPVFSSLAQKPAVLEKTIKRRLSNDPKGLARALKGFSVGAQSPLWDRLPSLALPVLLITGRGDKKYVELEHPEDFAENIMAFLSKQK